MSASGSAIKRATAVAAILYLGSFFPLCSDQGGPCFWAGVLRQERLRWEQLPSGADRSACRLAHERLHAPDLSGIEAYCGPISSIRCAPAQFAEWSASMAPEAACTRVRWSYMIAVHCVTIINAIGGRCGAGFPPGEDWMLERARRYAGERCDACLAARGSLCAGMP